MSTIPGNYCLAGCSFQVVLVELNSGAHDIFDITNRCEINIENLAVVRDKSQCSALAEGP